MVSAGAWWNATITRAGFLGKSRERTPITGGRQKQGEPTEDWSGGGRAGAHHAKGRECEGRDALSDLESSDLTAPCEGADGDASTIDCKQAQTEQSEGGG